jgi:hypothetical protein
MLIPSGYKIDHYNFSLCVRNNNFAVEIKDDPEQHIVIKIIPLRKIDVEQLSKTILKALEDC